jgi:hypothetical protein
LLNDCVKIECTHEFTSPSGSELRFSSIPYVPAAPLRLENKRSLACIWKGRLRTIENP